MQTVTTLAVAAGIGYLGYQWYTKCKVDNENIDVILHKEINRIIPDRKVLVPKDTPTILSYDGSEIKWNYKSITINPDETIFIEYLCLAKDGSYRESIKIKTEECINDLPTYLGTLTGGDKIKVKDIHKNGYKNAFPFDLKLKYTNVTRTKAVKGECDFKINEFKRLADGLELIGEEQIPDKMADINLMCNYGTDAFQNCNHQDVLTNAAFLRFCEDPTCEGKIKKDKEDIMKLKGWNGDGEYDDNIMQVNSICELSKNLRQGSCQGHPDFDDYQKDYDELCSDCNKTEGMVNYAREIIKDLNKQISEFVPAGGDGDETKEEFTERLYVDNAQILEYYCNGIKFLKDHCGIDRTNEPEYAICPVDCYLKKLYVKNGLNKEVDFGFKEDLNRFGLDVSGIVKNFCKSAEYLRDNCNDTSGVDSEHYKEWCPAECYLARIHFNWFKGRLSSVVSIKDNALVQLKKFKDYSNDDINHVEQMVSSAAGMIAHCGVTPDYFKDDLIYQFFTPIECFRAIITYDRERPKLFEGLPKFNYENISGAPLDKNGNPRTLNDNERNSIKNFSAALKVLIQMKDNNPVCEDYYELIKDNKTMDLHYYPGECFIAAMDIVYYYTQLESAELKTIFEGTAQLGGDQNEMVFDVHIPNIRALCNAVKTIISGTDCDVMQQWLNQRPYYTYYCPAECFIAKAKIGYKYKALQEAGVTFDMGEYQKSFEEFMGITQDNRRLWKAGDPPFPGSDADNLIQFCKYVDDLKNPDIGCMDVIIPIEGKTEAFSYRTWLETAFVKDGYNMLDDYCPAECFISRFKIVLAFNHLDNVGISFDMGEYQGTIDYGALDQDGDRKPKSLSKGEGVFFERDIPVIQELCQNIQFLKENCMKSENSKYKQWLLEERYDRYKDIIDALNQAILAGNGTANTIDSSKLGTDLTDTSLDIFCPADCFIAKVVIDLAYEVLQQRGVTFNGLSSYFRTTTLEEFETIDVPTIRFLCNKLKEMEGKDCPLIYKLWLQQYGGKYREYCPAECFIARARCVFHYMALQDEGIYEENMSAYFGEHSLEHFLEVGAPMVVRLCESVDILKDRNKEIECDVMYAEWINQNPEYDMYCPAKCFIARHVIIQTDKIIQSKHEYTYDYNNNGALELTIEKPSLSICNYKSTIKDDDVITLYEDLTLLQTKFNDLLINSNCGEKMIDGVSTEIEYFIDEKIKGIARKYYPVDAFMSVFIFKSIFKIVQDFEVSVDGLWLTNEAIDNDTVISAIKCLCSAYEYLKNTTNYNDDIAGENGVINRSETWFLEMIANQITVAEQMCPADYFINLSYFNLLKKDVNYNNLPELQDEVDTSEPLDPNSAWYAKEQKMRDFCGYAKKALDAVDFDKYKASVGGDGKYEEVVNYLQSHTFSGSGTSIYEAVCPAQSFIDFMKYKKLESGLDDFYEGDKLLPEYLGDNVKSDNVPAGQESHQNFLDFMPKLCAYKDEAYKSEKYRNMLNSTNNGWKKACPSVCSLSYSTFKHMSGNRGNDRDYCKFTSMLKSSQCDEFRERMPQMTGEEEGEYNQRCK